MVSERLRETQKVRPEEHLKLLSSNDRQETDRAARPLPPPPPLAGESVQDIVSYIAGSFARRLGLEYCAVYLYDEERANLVEAASFGRDRPHRSFISLNLGTSFADLEVTPGRLGGCFTVPLWDSRRLLGVVQGILPSDRTLDDAVMALSRAMAQGGALALSVALAAETGRLSSALGTLPAPMVQPPTVFSPNPNVARYLEASLSSASCLEPLAVALLRLAGPGRYDRLPATGRALPNGEGNSPAGRGYGFGADSNRLALIWRNLTRGEALDIVRPAALGQMPLGQVIGPARGDDYSGVRVSAAALALYPDDASDVGSLLGFVSDLLDLQTYLLATSGEEGRRKAPLPRDSAPAVMDSRTLAAEIDRQRQVLKEAIASGLSFQDNRVREISERLDRLIIVMQRFLGHRGAVPEAL